jgi:hypothetical protein
MFSCVPLFCILFLFTLMSCLVLLFAFVLLHNCQNHAAPHGSYVFKIERLLIQLDSPAQHFSESQDERSAIVGIFLIRVILVLSGRPFWKFLSRQWKLTAGKLGSYWKYRDREREEKGRETGAVKTTVCIDLLKKKLLM